MGYVIQKEGVGILEVGVTVTVPFEIYSVYAESAAILGDHTVQQVMGQVLCAYAKCILDGLNEEKITKKDCQLC